MNRPGGDGGVEDTKEDGEDADYITDPNYLDNDDIYRLPQYQRQPADLSLNFLSIFALNVIKVSILGRT